jgi:SAM-dependent methyltransferase
MPLGCGGATGSSRVDVPHRADEDDGRERGRSWPKVAVNDGHRVCDSPEWRAAVRGEIIPWAVRDVDLGDDVLEIGPGYGATTDVFADLLPRLTSVEIDPDLAARLQTRYAGTHVDVVLGDATQLSFPDGRFSGAVCFSMLHHVPSPELQDRLFAEVARVLRSGGSIVAVDSVESEGVRTFHEGDTYQPIDPSTLPARLHDAGFTSVEVRVNEYGWTALAQRA